MAGVVDPRPLWLLAHAELIAPIHEDAYEITGQGQRYLDGEYDVAWIDLPPKAYRDVFGESISSSTE